MRSTHSDNQVIDRLFVRLASNYGHLWSSQFKTLPMLSAAKTEWSIDLASKSVEQIGVMLEKCKKIYIKHPPTLPQFCALGRRAPCHAEFKRLPILQSSPETAKAAIASIRKQHGRPKFIRGQIMPKRRTQIKNLQIKEKLICGDLIKNKKVTP